MQFHILENALFLIHAQDCPEPENLSGIEEAVTAQDQPPVQPDIQRQPQEYQTQSHIGQLVDPDLLALRCDQLTEEHQDKAQNSHTHQHPGLPQAVAFPFRIRMHREILRGPGLVFLYRRRLEYSIYAQYRITMIMMIT